MRRFATAAVLVFAGACRCQPGLGHVELADLAAEPSTLVLPAAWVGQTTRASVEIINRGGPSDEAAVSLDLPFATVTKSVTLGRGESELVVVEFAPPTAGSHTATLRVGDLEVAVEGQGRVPPQCLAPAACRSVRFDFDLGECVTSVLPDSTACATSCVSGTCAAGTCVGQLIACDDHDACTVDLCGEADGCSHAPTQCPAPTSPCKVTACASATGCGFEDQLDGTLCGPDDCTKSEVDICLLGQCVRRPRPPAGRCSNRWVVTSPPPRTGVAGAYDFARGHLVVFGGSEGAPRNDTWELYGTHWVQRFPATSPPARAYHAMAWDSARRRIVLFGGEPGAGLLGDTWEWDGTNWLERQPPVSPPARKFHAMAYDPVRKRVLLFGGVGSNMPLSDTWEWNGLTWTQRTPATVPAARSIPAMAWDEARQRAVLHGAYVSGSPVTASTWEWDGTNWEQRAPLTQLPIRYTTSTMVYDPVRARTVLFATDTVTMPPAADVWEYDGSTWTLVPQPPPSAPPRYFHAAMYEPALQRVVVFGGSWGVYRGDTWSWNGAAWAQVTPPTPEQRYQHAAVYDAARQRVVLFGGWFTKQVGDTWEWDGATWSLKAPAAAPSARSGHQMAYDAARQRVVLFGGGFGDGGVARDTWEYDGTTWQARTPLLAPPARVSGAMAYDANRQRVTLFGGYVWNADHLGDTWEWDGAAWVDRTPDAGQPAPIARGDHSLVYDANRQRVQLFGGYDGLSGVPRDDVWEWDGAAWVELSPAVRPPARSAHSAAYDLDRGRTLLFGGFPGAGGLADTWESDGLEWSQRMPLDSPPGGSGNALAYDAARKRAVLISGADTWLFLP